MWMMLGRHVWSTPSVQATPQPEASPSQPVLASPEDYLPQHLAVGSEAPKAVFQDADGRPIPLRGLLNGQERCIWLVFWASWCPDCDRQLAFLPEMEKLAERYGARLVLVDRLNLEKESVEAARQKYDRYSPSAALVFDGDEKVYSAWGIREIPTSVILSGDGAVLSYASGVRRPGECEGLLRLALEGRSKLGADYLASAFSNGQGGIYTSTATGGESPSGKDILSESEGLMLLYALASHDRSLFDLTFSFLRSHMMVHGLSAWYTGSAGKAPVNATLDDLRLWYAFHLAGEKWGDDVFALQAAETGEAILSRCVGPEGGLTDYASLEGSGQARTISLCYLDLTCLRAMAESMEGFVLVEASARKILLEGRISDDFPFYYASYDYDSGSYSQADLNTAEALYTLWNLSRAGELPRDTWEYVRNRIETGELAARYHTDGTAVKGFEFHATAVWGLAALIAAQENDPHAYELASRRMNRMFIDDADDELFGAYAQKNAAVHAFDQLIPLLANTAAGKADFGECKDE